MRTIVLALTVLSLLAITVPVEAGPLRRVARGVGAAARAPFRGVAARRQARAERRAARLAAFGCN